MTELYFQIEDSNLKPYSGTKLQIDSSSLIEIENLRFYLTKEKDFLIVVFEDVSRAAYIVQLVQTKKKEIIKRMGLGRNLSASVPKTPPPPPSSVLVSSVTVELKDKTGETISETTDVVGEMSEIEKIVNEAKKIAEESTKTAEEAKRIAEKSTNQTLILINTADEAIRSASEAAKKVSEIEHIVNEAKKIAEESTKMADGAKKVTEESTRTAEEAKRIAEESTNQATISMNTASEAIKSSSEAAQKVSEIENIVNETKKIAEDSKKLIERAKKFADEARDVAQKATTAANNAHNDSNKASQNSQTAQAIAQAAQRAAENANSIANKSENSANLAKEIAENAKEIAEKSFHLSESSDSYARESHNISNKALQYVHDNAISEIKTLIPLEVQKETNTYFASDVFLNRLISIFNDEFVSDHVSAIIKKNNQNIYDILFCISDANICNNSTVFGFSDFFYECVFFRSELLRSEQDIQREQDDIKDEIFSIAKKWVKDIFGQKMDNYQIKGMVLNVNSVKKNVIANFLAYHYGSDQLGLFHCLGDYWMVSNEIHVNNNLQKKIQGTLFNVLNIKMDSILRMLEVIQKVYFLCVFICRFLLNKSGKLQDGCDLRREMNFFVELEEMNVEIKRNRRGREIDKGYVDLFYKGIFDQMIESSIVTVREDINNIKKIYSNSNQAVILLSQSEILYKIREFQPEDGFSQHFKFFFNSLSFCRKEWNSLSFLFSKRFTSNINNPSF